MIKVHIDKDKMHTEGTMHDYLTFCRDMINKYRETDLIDFLLFENVHKEGDKGIPTNLVRLKTALHAIERFGKKEGNTRLIKTVKQTKVVIAMELLEVAL